MATAEPAYLRGGASRVSETLETTRHSAVVRVTHWINALSFFGLVISGFAILLAHPRFYWGETGGIGTPCLFEFPLPYMKGGPSGWGRNLHFLVAWVCVANGVVYAFSGFVTRHFRRRFVTPNESYDRLQRIAYLTVVFGVLPFLTWTGFAMSPALTSIVPAFVTLLGGQQSARTLHLFAAIAIVVFFAAHIAMVCASGFRKHFLSMIFGKERA